MRILTLSAIVLTVLIAVVSVYFHLDTKQFIEELPTFPKSIPKDAVPVESSDQHDQGNRTAESDAQQKKNAIPAWQDDAASSRDDHGHTHTDDPSAEVLTQDTETQATEETPKENSEARQFDPNDPYQFHELRLKAYRKKWGDIPEIYILAEGRLKMSLGEEMTPEEKLTFFEAAYHLTPNPLTQRSIEMQKLIVAGDEDTLFAKYGELQPESEQPFIDVKPFFEENNKVEGFRRLRAANPKRAAEFEAFIRAEARKDPSMNLEEIKQEIRRSYEPPPEHN